MSRKTQVEGTKTGFDNFAGGGSENSISAVNKNLTGMQTLLKQIKKNTQRQIDKTVPIKL